MAAKMNEGPTFFMFFISEINNMDMKIAKAFMQCVEQSLPEKVFLRDRHNNIWIVKIAKVGKCWYFVDGWDKFASANLLTTGDLLVFEYFSDALFNVKIYGLSGTEKNVARSSTPETNHVETHDKKSKSNNVVDVDDEDEETESKSCNDSFTRIDRDDDESGDSDYTPTRDEYNEVVHEQINNDGAGVRENAADRLTCLYPKCYGMEIFEARLAQRPINPYFVTKIMPKRQSSLFIPMDVIKDYNVRLRDEIILIDPSGREFHTKCRKWNNGRWVLSGGWTHLCRVNHVSQEDSCICEFVQQQGDQRQFLHISFVRANV